MERAGASASSLLGIRLNICVVVAASLLLVCAIEPSPQQNVTQAATAHTNATQASSSIESAVGDDEGIILVLELNTLLAILLYGLSFLRFHWKIHLLRTASDLSLLSEEDAQVLGDIQHQQLSECEPSSSAPTSPTTGLQDVTLTDSQSPSPSPSALPVQQTTLSLSQKWQSMRASELLASFRRLYNIVTMPEHEVLHRHGRLAVLYFKFQVTMIKVLCVCSVLAVTILLPINVTGGAKKGGFAATTFHNLTLPGEDTSKLWALTVVGVVFACVIFNFLNKLTDYSESVHQDTRGREGSQWSVVRRTLLVTNIPTQVQTRGEVFSHFELSCPGKIRCVTMVVNGEELSTYQRRLASASASLLRCQQRVDATTERPTHMVKGRRGVEQVDSLSYYAEVIKECEEGIQRIQLNRHNNVTGRAFITFADQDSAWDVHTAYCSGLPWQRPCFPRLRHWYVEFAPAPSDIIWNHVHISRLTTLIKMIVLNVPVLVALFFFSSPLAMISSVPALTDDYDVKFMQQFFTTVATMPSASSSFVFHYIPTLLVAVMNLLLLYVMYYTSKFEGHHTRSGSELWIMRKCFMYLLINTLLCPGLLLTSVGAIARSFAQHNILSSLGSIFLVNSGSFFVNLLLQTALLAAPLQLLHFPEVAWALLIWTFSRLRACCRKGEKSIPPFHVKYWPFEYGYYYAYMLDMLAIAVTFSTTVPVILPVALLYFVLKFVTDKIDILAFSPSEYDTDSKLAGGVVTQSLLGVGIFSLCMAGFFFVNAAIPQALVMLVLLGAVVAVSHRLARRRQLTKDTKDTVSTPVGEDIKDIEAVYTHPYLLDQ